MSTDPDSEPEAEPESPLAGQPGATDDSIPDFSDFESVADVDRAITEQDIKRALGVSGGLRGLDDHEASQLRRYVKADAIAGDRTATPEERARERVHLRYFAPLAPDGPTPQHCRMGRWQTPRDFPVPDWFAEYDRHLNGDIEYPRALPESMTTVVRGDNEAAPENPADWMEVDPESIDPWEGCVKDYVRVPASPMAWAWSYGVWGDMIPFVYQSHDLLRLLRYIRHFVDSYLRERPTRRNWCHTDFRHRRDDDLYHFHPEGTDGTTFKMLVSERALLKSGVYPDARQRGRGTDCKGTLYANPAYVHHTATAAPETPAQRVQWCALHAAAESEMPGAMSDQYGIKGESVKKWRLRLDSDWTYSELTQVACRYTARTWYLLREWGYSKQDIAAAAGVTRKTVENRVYDYIHSAVPTLDPSEYATPDQIPAAPSRAWNGYQALRVAAEHPVPTSNPDHPDYDPHPNPESTRHRPRYTQ